MIALRRAGERHHDRRKKRDVWLTFYPQGQAGPLAEGFGDLEILNEGSLPPGASVPRHAHQDAEIVTYVREGSLAYQESLGRSGVLQAGEFQRMTVRRGARHIHTNVSRSDWVHVFQLWLCPSAAGVEPSHEQTRFSVAQRRGAPCVVASPDGRRGSLPIHQDVEIFSVILDRGQHVAHELAPGRSAWLHLVDGEVAFGDGVLTTGDGAGFTAERAVSFTARQQSELLLLDLREQGGTSRGRRGSA
ncbi:MAG: pirin family protein [Deltaproteobacteria bacterium]|jgi:redox-sensitive bicupin YhaK (pirin superfamily)|nr:pirin family protein [Deltaproteobacteria bacterium]MBW2537198.1 pirin family protein [Deltaproteobacteria bacterium]